MLMALMMVVTVTYGQKKGEKTLLKTEVMAEKLGLDDKQKAALDKQLKEAAADRKAQMEKLKALREEMMRDAFVAQQAREANLKEILTAEQWAEYEKLKAERKKQGNRGKATGRRFSRGGGAEGQGKLEGRPGMRFKMKKRLENQEKEGNDDEDN
ncbi:MAG: hypothetical protein Roseis2KO_25590 [Roseivirga sp.]